MVFEKLDVAEMRPLLEPTPIDPPITPTLAMIFWVFSL